MILCPRFVLTLCSTCDEKATIGCHGERSLTRVGGGQIIHRCSFGRECERGARDNAKAFPELKPNTTATTIRDEHKHFKSNTELDKLHGCAALGETIVSHLTTKPRVTTCDNHHHLSLYHWCFLFIF